MAKDLYVPVLKTRRDINIEAIQKIDQERSGKQLGLKSRFSAVNKFVGKYFRFKSVYLIAGGSGHGKSTFLNMLIADFLNKSLNRDFEPDVIVVHNTFEMLPVDEVLRSVSGKVEKSHLGLLSAEWIPSEVEGQPGKYNTISDEEVDKIKEALTVDEESNHYFFEEPTSVAGILKNIRAGIAHYQAENNTTTVPHTVVALDHTLLVETEKGESTLDMIARLAKVCVILKKQGYLILLVGQLNGEIEKSERIKNPDLHYPMKSDIYAQGQLFNACDGVITIHQPELLGILEYGKNRFSTSLLVHVQFVKQRFGKVGSMWLKNALNIGKFLPFEPASNRK